MILLFCYGIGIGIGITGIAPIGFGKKDMPCHSPALLCSALYLIGPALPPRLGRDPAPSIVLQDSAARGPCFPALQP